MVVEDGQGWLRLDNQIVAVLSDCQLRLHEEGFKYHVIPANMPVETTRSQYNIRLYMISTYNIFVAQRCSKTLGGEFPAHIQPILGVS